MINQCTFIGNLGADPETRGFQDGGKICNFRIAVTDKWRSKDGERKERTEWVAVTITTDGLIGVAEKYLRKGSKVLVQGQFRTRKYQAQDGSDRYASEIVLGPRGILQMLDGKPDSQQGERSQAGTQSSGGWGKGADSTASGFADDLDDEIPF